MAARVIEWDREKLYDQIWTRPLRTVAHENGLSDVALAKVCKKLHIPRPGVGYWRRKECGFKVERVPLPPAKEIVTVASHLPDFQEKKPRRLSEELIPPEKSWKRPRRSTPLSSKLSGPLQTATQTSFGRVQAEWRISHLDIRVTRVGMVRALKFMDMLVKLLEANNMTVTPGTRREPAVIRVDGEQIRVTLKEEVRGRKRELTREEKRNQERPFSSQKDFAWATMPAIDSCLRSRITRIHSGDGQTQSSGRSRRTSSTSHAAYLLPQHSRSGGELSGKRRGVSLSGYNGCIIKSSRAAAYRKAEAKHYAWEEAQRIRAYLAAVEEKTAAHESGLAADKAMSRFLKWGRRYADSLDATGSPAIKGHFRRCNTADP